jgi:uncharacterized protein
LDEVGARQIDKGVRWLFARAENLAQQSDISLSHALTEVNIALVGKVRRSRVSAEKNSAPAKLFCDAGLGGLARWLRASGCEAIWVQDISDADLVRRAEELNAVIVTTDSFLLDRRPIAHGRVRAIWVPPTLTIFEQLRLVRAELGLDPSVAGSAVPNESRCMVCGGELVSVEKEAVKERIPPRTYRWLDEYWECTRCGKLFWHGTHWERVKRRLKDEV